MEKEGLVSGQVPKAEQIARENHSQGAGRGPNQGSGNTCPAVFHHCYDPVTVCMASIPPHPF